MRHHRSEHNDRREGESGGEGYGRMDGMETY